MQYSWTKIKKDLCELIKEISDRYGGDDLEWLRAYCKEVIDIHRDELFAAMSSFQLLDDQTKPPMLSFGKELTNTKDGICQDGIEKV